MTAASTPKGQKYGYVFRNCRFTGNSSRESVYLGRPWRDYARTVLIDCYLGPHICREGWHDWDKKNARSTLFYGEYASYGPWVFMLTREQIQDYTMEQVLGGTDGWNPGAYI